ncbi:TIR domain-containing protein [Rhodococcus hoagii]|nr:TIR domain-containing protein [Prescottella equi]
MEHGTRGDSWTLQGGTLLSTLSDLDPVFDSRIFPTAHLSEKTYTVFTKHNNFSRTSSYTNALQMAGEEPHRIIAHYGNIVRADRDVAVKSVDIIYHSQTNDGTIVVQIEVSGNIGRETNAYFQGIRDWFDSEARNANHHALKSNSAELSAGSIIRHRGSSIEVKSNLPASMFDEADELLSIQGVRAPRVFISYSHDDDDHKKWVWMLANRLNSLRVWAIFDQFDLTLGSNLAAFMEGGLSQADRVLAICTPNYVDKANKFQGGTGYERTILTQDLMSSQVDDRIIPVIRGQKQPARLPVFLSSKLYIDFSDDAQFDAKFVELGSEILNPGGKRPPFGQPSH